MSPQSGTVISVASRGHLQGQRHIGVREGLFLALRGPLGFSGVTQRLSYGKH